MMVDSEFCRLVYSSSACNKSPRCLSWGNNNLIIYGSSCSVVVFKPEDNGGTVIRTLTGHSKPVTSVQWINKEDGDDEFLSTSIDHTVIIWSLCGSEFKASHVLTGHSNVVKTASAVYQNEASSRDLTLASSSADSSIKIWKRHNNEVRCTDTISFGNAFAIDIKLTMLVEPINDVLLAVGGDDFKIHLYLEDRSEAFIKVASLIGHEAWVQSLDFMRNDLGDFLLASASQDEFIRIWKITCKKESDNEANKLLRLKETSFQTYSGIKYTVTLESVLAGHENWIYSVKWKDRQLKDDVNVPQLLSTSMDKTMIIWEQDTVSNMWVDKVRVGMVGGNTLGLYGGSFSPDGDTIIAYGYQGAVHLWKRNKELNTWQPGYAFGGHFEPVHDIEWDLEGSYLLSCSIDQTTRLHARVLSKGQKVEWHEIARPQVHGYDMICLCILNRYKFISGADEKILRVFEAPKSFAENLKNISGVDTSCYISNMLPEGASVPSLGLSNKAVFETDIQRASEMKNADRHAKDLYPDHNYTPVTLKEPPAEELLLQNTLWPEVQKLYGHPYEIFTVTCNHGGTIVASSCKASKAEHAAIILWNTTKWRQLGKLVFHTLTVTQMEFSPDDQYLVSVSRDRTWALYQYFADESPPYRRIAQLDKKSGVHTRIIWSCSWSHDSRYFATSSRDKKVAVWHINDVSSADDHQKASLSSALEVEDSATAVRFAPCLTESQMYIIAVGFENGHIAVYTWQDLPEGSNSWHPHYTLNENDAHHLTVNKLKFSLVDDDHNEEKHSKQLMLASCGNDHFVKIYQICKLL